MTARVQHQRLNTTTQIPGALSRAPGEMWLNYPDLRLGIIDAAKQPQDLLAIRRHAATATYALGDFVTQGGQLYRSKAAIGPKAFAAADWDQMIAQPYADGRYLQLTGGALTGPLTLQADPTNPLHAATKQYTDLRLLRSGGTMTGFLTLNADPTNPLHAATKQSVAADIANSNLFLRLTGGTLTGTLTAGDGIIYGNITPPADRHQIAFGWTGSVLNAQVDNTLIGGLATRNFVTSGYLPLTGNSTVNGTVTVTHLGVAGNAQVNFDLKVLGTASKPGGGLWADASDLRVKTVHGPYETGLADLLKLKPVRYTFKQNASMNGYNLHQFENGRVRVGLVAQDTEAVWPSMVTQVPGFIDNEPVNDLRIMDPSELSFAVLNALRELNERVTNLEEDA